MKVVWKHQWLVFAILDGLLAFVFYMTGFVWLSGFCLGMTFTGLGWWLDDQIFSLTWEVNERGYHIARCSMYRLTEEQ